MSFMSEFKSFAMRGNVIDLAVGVVIGAAFGRIVSSLVDDVIMPPIGKILGNVDFANLFINLSGKDYPSVAAAKAAAGARMAARASAVVFEAVRGCMGSSSGCPWKTGGCRPFRRSPAR